MKPIKKRGQATIFIIIGLIILIAIFILAGTLLMKEEVKPTYTEITDASVQPIKNDIEFCLKQTAKETIKEIGLRGGYTEKRTQYYITDHMIEKDNDALAMFPGSNIKIPYWLSVKEAKGNAYLIDKIPELTYGDNSIKAMMEEKINEEMLICMNNFEEYKINSKIIYGEPNSEVIFTENNVFIGLTWPMNITIEQEEFSISKFQETLNIKFKDIYDLARLLMIQTEQYNSTHLEDVTLNLLNIYSQGKNGPIPPIEGPKMSNDDDFVMWTKEQVTNELKDIISGNLIHVQVPQSRESFLMFSTRPGEYNMYEGMQVPFIPLNDYYQKTKIRFEYIPLWPLYINIDPGFGEIYMPEIVSQNFLFLSFISANYNFKYDLAYPALISIEDDEAFNGEGYRFQYAYEVNIRRNKPLTKNLNWTKAVPKQNELDLESQRTAQLTLQIKDGYTGKAVDGITAMFSCANQEFPLGISETENYRSTIKTTITPCIDAKIYVINKNYSANPIYLTSQGGQSYEETIEVYQPKEIPIEFKRKIYIPNRPITDLTLEEMDRLWQINPGAPSIYPLDDEQIMMVLVQEDEQGTPTKGININYNNTIENPKINITPGTYKLNLVSILQLKEPKYPNGTKITMPIRISSDATTIIPGTTPDPIDLKPIMINDTLVAGMLTYDKTTKLLTLKSEDVAKAKKIIVTYPSYNPDDIQISLDMQVIGLISDQIPNDNFNFQIIK
ncbi:hypothetical protein K9L97_04000 [Candidatus Woesearchaeota archaeon]|nr:hypothetical protein [Candidatus Woesearchaeota archaeon]